jgi:superfamily I DNA and/or RNA helicase
MRILVSASNYVAIDNVLLQVASAFQDGGFLPEGSYSVRRLRSYLRVKEERVPEAIDVSVNRYAPEAGVLELRNRLQANEGITIVGSSPEQVANLMQIAPGGARLELFDLILIDEASQLDVGHAILALCSLAAGGSVVLAGDHKQLPPIHKAEPPLELDAMVGSIYDFCREVHGVEPEPLTINYRSNETVVEFARSSGYPEHLESYSPELRLNLVHQIPEEQPANWPESLCWTPAWTALLDPRHPAVCFVYDEGRASQWNPFEADAVAALITLLNGRVAAQLHGERDINGQLIQEGLAQPYSPLQFWRQAVGVVTPHRAQQALIVNRLQQIFGEGNPEAMAAIRDAVDTVERFQGQQRDVMIASFALGDPDAIRDEDEFLLSLNRFNVMASRARAKLIVLVSQQVVDHLSSDLETLHGSALLKSYVDTFCNQAQDLSLEHFDDGECKRVNGLLKVRE